MKTRRSYFARTLAFVVAAAWGMSQPRLAQAQSDEAQSGDGDVLSRASVWHDPEVPALGNPEGDVTLVEYFDYQCPVWRQLHPQLSRTVREDGRVRLDRRLPRAHQLLAAWNLAQVRPGSCVRP
jgi:protein-disulfide isomerase